VDPVKIVSIFERLDSVALIKSYLVSVQASHNPIINQALNEVLLAEEDVEGLQLSINRSDRFDTDALARRLAAHALPQFRRLAAHIYKQARRWEDAIAILKNDALYSEAVALAAESKSRACAEGLLRYFGELGNETMFAACLVNAYGLIRPDVALEIGWKQRWQDTLIPFMCQSMREYQERVDRLEREMESLRTVKESAQAHASNGFIGAMGNLMISAPPPNPSPHLYNSFK
jgi:clathrin heavy chain